MQTSFSDITESLLKESKKYVGLKQFKRALHEEEISYVVLAEDADASLKADVCAECSMREIPVKPFPKMRQLGESVGIDVSAAVVTVIKV